MKVEFRVTRRSVALLAGIVTLVTAAGLAYATIPGSDGVISACRDTKTGALRAIDAEAGQTCSSKEAPLTWNQTGPQGPPGTAAAYARIGADGTVNTDFALGITSANVSHPGTGIYCLRNLGFQPRAVVGIGPAGLTSDGAGGVVPAGYDTNVTANLRLATDTSFLALCGDTAATPLAERAVVRIYVAGPNGLVDMNFGILLDD
jgi:hypothetical protein